MMGKIAPWVGSDITERLFVPLLVQLSVNPEFIIRLTCTTIFGEICTVVGTQIAETKLVSIRLCIKTRLTIKKSLKFSSKLKKKIFYFN